jgi:copper homeostasis protein
MVRPRAGGFCYSDAEIEVMLRDIEALRAGGAAGVVFGVLTPEHEVDVDRCRVLVEAAGPLQTVFHRAFDLVAGMDRALDALMDLGVTRVLTSGGRPTALQGAADIRRLIDRAAGRVDVLPGGGVRAANAVAVLEATCAQALHLGPSVAAIDASGQANPELSFGEPGGLSGGHRELDVGAVRHVCATVAGWKS